MSKLRRLSRFTAAILALTIASAFTPAIATGAVHPVTLADALALHNRDATARTCYHDVTFTSKANNRYVSAELGWTDSGYGRLRARATVVDDWELYEVCFNGTKSTIRSTANNRYVSAEIGWSGNNYGLLRARASEAKEWERFSFTSCGSDCVLIRSTANDRLVSAEIGWTGARYGLLRARATVADDWEYFE